MEDPVTRDCALRSLAHLEQNWTLRYRGTPSPLRNTRQPKQTRGSRPGERKQTRTLLLLTVGYTVPWYTVPDMALTPHPLRDLSTTTCSFNSEQCMWLVAAVLNHTSQSLTDSTTLSHTQPVCLPALSPLPSPLPPFPHPSPQSRQWRTSAASPATCRWRKVAPVGRLHAAPASSSSGWIDPASAPAAVSIPRPYTVPDMALTPHPLHDLSNHVFVQH